MRVHQRSQLPPRPAFTLVELTVVIGIVLALAVLTIMIFPRLQDSQRVAKGADVVQGQLFLAKQMALRDQLPRGVRLIPDSSGYVTSLQLIEQPLLYNKGTIAILPTAADISGPTTGLWRVTFGPEVNSDFANGSVLPGDFLDLYRAGDPYTVNQHAMHKIMRVEWVPPPPLPPGPPSVPTPTAPTIWVLTQPTLPSGATGSATAPLGLPYSIVRSPRAMVGVNPVALPPDVVVDYPSAPGHPALGTSLALPASAPWDILFDPSGKVLGAAGVNGKVVLWVYDWTTGVAGTPAVPVSPTPGAPEQSLVAVYTRTGNIVAQPVNVAGSDPYAFVKDGATSGM